MSAEPERQSEDILDDAMTIQQGSRQHEQGYLTEEMLLIETSTTDNIGVIEVVAIILNVCDFYPVLATYDTFFYIF